MDAGKGGVGAECVEGWQLPMEGQIYVVPFGRYLQPWKRRLALAEAKTPQGHGYGPEVFRALHLLQALEALAGLACPAQTGVRMHHPGQGQRKRSCRVRTLEGRGRIGVPSHREQRRAIDEQAQRELGVALEQIFAFPQRFRGTGIWGRPESSQLEV